MDPLPVAKRDLRAGEQKHPYTGTHTGDQHRLYTNSSPAHSDHTGKTAMCTRPGRAGWEVGLLERFLKWALFFPGNVIHLSSDFLNKTCFKAN